MAILFTSLNCRLIRDEKFSMAFNIILELEAVSWGFIDRLWAQVGVCRIELWRS